MFKERMLQKCRHVKFKGTVITMPKPVQKQQEMSLKKTNGVGLKK